MAHDKGNHYFRRVLQGVETSVSDSHESSNAIAGVEIVGKKRVRPGYEIQSSASVKMVFASAFSPAKTAALPAGGILPFILPNWQQAAIKQAGSPRQISRQSVVNGNAGITPILPGIPPQDLGKFWPEIPQSCHLSCQNGRISLGKFWPEIPQSCHLSCQNGRISLAGVRGFGGRVASVMTFSTLPAGIHRGRPRPFLSRNPSKPSRSKRCDHLFTQGTLTPSSSASCACLTPSERRSTIVARRLSRTDLSVLSRDAATLAAQDL